MHDLLQLHIARDYRSSELNRARHQAHLNEARAMRAADSRAPARRALGRSLIRLGERIAAEPAMRPARSR